MRSDNLTITQLMQRFNRFVIPVYQRPYSWDIGNCKQLYKDLRLIMKEKRKSYFLGCFVSHGLVLGNDSVIRIIDGQQRLTTVTLILLAVSNLIKEKKVTSDTSNLDRQILGRYLMDDMYAYEGTNEGKIKLELLDDDQKALDSLFSGNLNPEAMSNIIFNYNFFYNSIKEDVQANEYFADDLYTSIGKLQIINITLEDGDDPQLIFESLNSTGLALTEVDKIRNYVLMGLNSDDQERLYKTWWLKIEGYIRNSADEFMCNYLSIKQRKKVKENLIYQEFKNYVETNHLQIENLLEDILKYASLYFRLLNCTSEYNSELNNSLYRLKRLGLTVAYPFELEVLRLNKEKQLSDKDTLHIFKTLESYVFRRFICDLPSNRHRQFFVSLHYNITHSCDSVNEYLTKFYELLCSKTEVLRFPNDKEFREALAAKSVYQMDKKYRIYLFEQLENYDTRECKNIYDCLDRKDYTIEHIMPQKLSGLWRFDLGEKADELHDKWLHKLANLTITAYNCELSNKQFYLKRDSKRNGYKYSGLRINQQISHFDRWGEKELQERQKYLLDLAVKIWKRPQVCSRITVYKEGRFSLEDDFDFTGSKLIKFEYKGREYHSSDWADMYKQVVNYLYTSNSVPITMVADGNNPYMSKYFSKSNCLRSSFVVGNSIFCEVNTNTQSKISILRQLFDLYGISKSKLVFTIKSKVYMNKM